MLREDRAAKEQKERLTEIALKEMERLNGIITDFLMYSTPRAAEFSAFDLNLVLDDTLELLKIQHPQGRIFLSRRISTGRFLLMPTVRKCTRFS